MYAAPGGVPLSFDVFLPDGEPPFPAVVCIHGGGWISGEKEGMHDVAAFFARHGFAGVCMGYRLAPLHPFPAPVEDVKACIGHLRAHGLDVGVDPNKLATFGNSAGGHLAAMAGLVLGQGLPVEAVISVCPLTDLTRPGEQHFPISWSFLEQFMGVPYEGNEETYEAASPLFAVHPGAAPFFLVHGDADDIVPVAQSDALAAALNRAGIPADYRRLADEGHALSEQAWNELMAWSVEFLRGKLS